MVSMHYLRKLYLVSQYFEHLASAIEGECADHRQVDLIVVAPYHETLCNDARVLTLLSSSSDSLNLQIDEAIYHTQ